MVADGSEHAAGLCRAMERAIRCTRSTACGIAAGAATTEDTAENAGAMGVAATAWWWCEKTLEGVAFVGA